MKPADFVAKWSQIQQKEMSVAQSHFNDLCALAGHDDPITADPAGEFFTFEEGALKPARTSRPTARRIASGW